MWFSYLYKCIYDSQVSVIYLPHFIDKEVEAQKAYLPKGTFLVGGGGRVQPQLVMITLEP